MTFADILSSIEKLPNAFWAVLGSFITAVAALTAMVLSNRASYRRLREQLIHDRDLKTHERNMSLRREVFLAAAEAINAGMASFGRFANLELSADQVTAAYVEKQPSIAKVYVVANDETVRAVTQLVTELNASQLSLFARRIPISELKTKFENLKSQIGASAVETGKMFSLLKQLTVDGTTDERKLHILQKSCEFEEEQMTETAKECDKVTADLHPIQMSYLKHCMLEANRLSQFVTRALIAARRELEMPINETEYANMIEANGAQQIRHFDEFLAELMKMTRQPERAEGGQQSGSLYNAGTQK